MPYLHGVFAAGVLDGNVPNSAFRKALRFPLRLCLRPRRRGGRSCRRDAADIDIPVGEKPMRLLGDEENRVCPVALRQFAGLSNSTDLAEEEDALESAFSVFAAGASRDRIRLSLSIPLIFRLMIACLLLRADKPHGLKAGNAFSLRVPVEMQRGVVIFGYEKQGSGCLPGNRFRQSGVWSKFRSVRGSRAAVGRCIFRRLRKGCAGRGGHRGEAFVRRVAARPAGGSRVFFLLTGQRASS